MLADINQTPRSEPPKRGSGRQGTIREAGRREALARHKRGAGRREALASLRGPHGLTSCSSRGAGGRTELGGMGRPPTISRRRLRRWSVHASISRRRHGRIVTDNQGWGERLALSGPSPGGVRAIRNAFSIQHSISSNFIISHRRRIGRRRRSERIRAIHPGTAGGKGERRVGGRGAAYAIPVPPTFADGRCTRRVPAVS